jgi:hypothetical protein
MVIMKSVLFFAIVFLLPVIAFAQNVGIGTSDPVTRLDVEEGHVLFFAPGLVSSETPVFTAPDFGRYMLWQANKGAFRTGLVFGNDLDEALIGNYTFASGQGNEASGNWAGAIGYGNRASQSGTIAFGYQSQALGVYSFAAGNLAKATGETSVAMGDGSVAAGDFAVAIGSSNIAQGRGSVALGLQNNAWACGSFVAGLYNDTTHSGSDVLPQSGNRIFQVGNGTSLVARSNALTILQNGNTGIGVLEPVEKLSVAGNAVFTGDIMVQNDKGIIRNADNTQLKKLGAAVLVNATFTAGETKTFTISWPQSFNGDVEAYVGNIVTGSTAGWAELMMSIADVTDTGATLYVYNPHNTDYNADYSVRIIAMGKQ